ncbi:unnamed protein product, partial [Ectocarpus sp. 6 AP-2014]
AAGEPTPLGVDGLKATLPARQPFPAPCCSSSPLNAFASLASRSVFSLSPVIGIPLADNSRRKSATFIFDMATPSIKGLPAAEAGLRKAACTAAPHFPPLE